MSNKPVFVTQPHLPPLEEFMPYLRQIWETKVLTNGGQFHKQLEVELAKYLGVPYVCLFTNATVALVTALQALRITGEVITTPYSFVATAHSLLWNGIEPVFADIDIETFNIKVDSIESAITAKTTAIMPVHCYGRPCDIDAIARLAEKYNLKVIYDAAHAFGVRQDGSSILNAGDMSILSFHATKVYNTFEGGAIICQDLRTKTHIDHLKNFGFVDETTVVAAGINGKMSEFNASLGLVQLKQMPQVLAAREAVDKAYRHLLSGMHGLVIPDWPERATINWSYFPIRITSDFPVSRDELYAQLKCRGIHARRYFYPLISEFPMYRNSPSAQQSNLPQACQASREVICLPQHTGLRCEDIERIAGAIVEIACTHAPLLKAA